MSRSTSLSIVSDPDRLAALRGSINGIVTRTTAGRLGLVKRPGWIAVAAEEALLSTDEWRQTIVAMLERDGVDVLYAVPLQSAIDEPPLEVPATQRGLAEMQTELGAFDFVLFPPGEGWAIVSTREDIAAFLGPEDVIPDIIGGDPAKARAELEEFLDHEDFWPSDVLAYFRRLIAAIEAYDGLADGEITELPINV